MQLFFLFTLMTNEYRKIQTSDDIFLSIEHNKCLYEHEKSMLMNLVQYFCDID